MNTNISFNELYQKQMSLPNIGELGQKRISESRVLVVGAGGLGCPAILYLAAAGVGKIGICDNDNVELTNLPRQTLYTTVDIGKSKAEMAYNRVSKINPYSNISIYKDRIDSSNITEIASKFDIILDCTDNLETKFVVHDFAFKLKKDLVQASLYQYDGQIFVFPFSKLDEHEIACNRCMWKEVPKKYERNTSVHGVISMVPGILGIVQSLEVIKLILNINSKYESKGYLYNFLNNSSQSFGWVKNKNCLLCGDSNE